MKYEMLGRRRYERPVSSPGECQDACLLLPDCNWFTHFDTQCYLLAECGQTERLVALPAPQYTAPLQL